MKTIILPTDFSPAAMNALHYGMNMALAVDAELVLFNAYEIPVTLADVPLVFVSPEELKSGIDEKLETLKKEVEHISSGKLKIHTESQLGVVADTLEDLCKRIRPFAIVMGTKGHTGMEKVIFGSTSLSVIRHLTWPVICVPPGKQFGTGIKKIGLACDFKDINETLPADFIKQFIREFHSELHVLNADHNDHHFSPDTPQQSIALNKLLEEVHPIYHFIERRDVEEGINEFSEKNNLDLVITIPKKHKGWESVFKPNTTKKLMRHAHIPVMCVHE